MIASSYAGLVLTGTIIETKLGLPFRPATKQQHQGASIKPRLSFLDAESPCSSQVAGPIPENTADATLNHDTRQRDNQEEPKEPVRHPKLSVSLPTNDTRDSSTGETSSSKQKFACPYLKQDPVIWGQQPNCRGPSFATIHRLK